MEGESTLHQYRLQSTHHSSNDSQADHYEHQERAGDVPVSTGTIAATGTGEAFEEPRLRMQDQFSPRWVDKHWAALTLAIHVLVAISMAATYGSISNDLPINDIAKTAGATSLLSMLLALFTLPMWILDSHRDDRGIGPYVYAFAPLITFPIGFIVCGAKTKSWSLSAQVWFGCLAPVVLWLLYAANKFTPISRRLSLSTKVLKSLHRDVGKMFLLGIVAINIWMVMWSLLLAVAVSRQLYVQLAFSIMLLIWVPGIVIYVNRSVVAASVSQLVTCSSASVYLPWKVVWRCATSNLGSMCAAAFLLPLTKTLRTVALCCHEFLLHGQDHGQCGFYVVWCACCICLSVLSRPMKLLKSLSDNAIVHISLYGTPFEVSSKTSAQPFQNTRWRNVRDDPATGVVNTIGSLAFGSLVALVSFCLSYSFNFTWDLIIYHSIIGAVVGFTNLAMVNSVLDIVDTTLLQYIVEDDSALQASLPTLHSSLSTLFQELLEQRTETEEEDETQDILRS
eukprot:gb/GECG01011252.1/.p1 GENE.gb/GECG01011252.1/~~gb/GECG01011252.1/.p1  ORF type:complete len:508 (+),score=33.90 gb/GECG01011252.1/:1-1524(+)